MAPSPPPACPPPCTIPAKPSRDVCIVDAAGRKVRRFGTFQAARRLLGCDKDKLAAILRTGLIYAWRAGDAANSWWTIDLAGILLYRDHRRRTGAGLPPDPAWLEYAGHMERLNATPARAAGHPPVQN